MDALLLELLGRLDALPRGGDLDEHALARDPGLLVEPDQLARLVDRGRRVVREARVDLGRDAARHDLEDVQAELDRQPIDREVDDLRFVAAGISLRESRNAPSTMSRYASICAAAVISDGFVVASRGLNVSIDLMSPVSATTTVMAASWS